MHKTLKQLSFLEGLPAEIILAIFEIMDDKSAKKCKIALAQTSRTMHNFFQPRLNTDIVPQLLGHVNNANHDLAKKMVTLNPTLMFMELPDPDTESLTTPLKLAFKNYDTLMWQIFKEAASRKEEHIDEFFKQKKEQTEYVDLDSLLKAYLLYNIRYQSLPMNEDDFSVKIAWLIIGAEQKKIPKHFLKIFCSSLLWSNSPHAFKMEFLNINSPESDKIYDHDANSYTSLFMPDIFSNLGSSFTLISKPDHQNEAKVWAVSHPENYYDSAMRDCGVFTQLFNTKKTDLMELEEESILLDSSLCKPNALIPDPSPLAKSARGEGSRTRSPFF